MGKKLVVAHFDADQGEHETFLNMEPVYTESADGSRRLDYGAKYSNVAVFRITVIKEDGGDFSVQEVREHLKWLTGSKKNSPLDLCENFSEEFVSNGATNKFTLTNACDHVAGVYINGDLIHGNQWSLDKSNNSVQLVDTPKKNYVVKIVCSCIKYSFVCRVTNAWQHKLDARTIGIILEFTSVSPWAYSAKQVVTASVNGSTTIRINNETDDLYNFTPMNIVFKNTTGNSLEITNNATGETAELTELSVNEIITISDNFMITSDNASKIFGNKFNFVFPKLIAGENQIIVKGNGSITFEYVYAIKVGDLAIDINIMSDPICADDGRILLDKLPFNRITDLPNNFQAYNIQNVYSKDEVDALVANIEIDEDELMSMLAKELA